MIKSMTGFGRSTYENEGREYIIEIKSVNNRFTDINIKMPRNLNYLEEKIRKQILSNISRGKVEVSIQLNNNSDLGKKINLNTDIAKKYVEELKKLSEETNIIDNINIMDVARFPDVLNIRIDEEFEEYTSKQIEKFEELWNNYEIASSIQEIWNIVSRTNKYIDETMPWALFKEEKIEELKDVMYHLVEVLRKVAILIKPCMEESSAKIFEQLMIKDENLMTWDSIKTYPELGRRKVWLVLLV